MKLALFHGPKQARFSASGGGGDLISFSALRALPVPDAAFTNQRKFDRAALPRCYLSEIEGMCWKELPKARDLETEIPSFHPIGLPGCWSRGAQSRAGQTPFQRSMSEIRSSRNQIRKGKMIANHSHAH